MRRIYLQQQSVYKATHFKGLAANNSVTAPDQYSRDSLTLAAISPNDDRLSVSEFEFFRSPPPFPLAAARPDTRIISLSGFVWESITRWDRQGEGERIEW